MSTVEENLLVVLGATGQPAQSKEEGIADFLYRLTVSVSSLPNDKWKALPKEIQVWYNNSVVAFDAGADLFTNERVENTEG